MIFSPCDIFVWFITHANNVNRLRVMRSLSWEGYYQRLFVSPSNYCYTWHVVWLLSARLAWPAWAARRHRLYSSTIFICHIQHWNTSQCKGPRSNLYGLICNKMIWIIVFSKKRREKRNPKYIFIITFRTLASQRASPIKTRLDLLLGCLFSGTAPSPLAKVL